LENTANLSYEILLVYIIKSDCMKRIFTMISAAALVLTLGAVFTACEGPAGKDGLNGKDGAAGTNGLNGKDGNATCGVCHNQGTVMFAKILEYENSVHFTGGDIEGDRGNPCISCHTSEGFVQRAATGLDTATSISATYSPINCRTCHFIHTNYDTTDWSLRTTSQVALMINKSITLPDLGKGNLCAHCHQPRLPTPMVGAVGTDTITITSNRWGLHHGPQSALLTGNAAYQFASAATYGSSSHKNAPDGCIQCHMSYSLNLTAGGHTFKAGYLSGTTNTINLGACTSCHNGSITAKITALKITSDQNAIDTLISHLAVKLIAAKILDPATLLLKATTSKPLKITNDQAGAVLNYQMVSEDRSHGVHNLNYATYMLNASIAIFP
jgi:hypothetical protein